VGLGTFFVSRECCSLQLWSRPVHSTDKNMWHFISGLCGLRAQRGVGGRGFSCNSKKRALFIQGGLMVLDCSWFHEMASFRISHRKFTAEFQTLGFFPLQNVLLGPITYCKSVWLPFIIFILTRSTSCHVFVLQALTELRTDARSLRCWDTEVSQSVHNLAGKFQ
jgi:hypothetical protein